jgi:hypothetical protein
MSRKRKHETVVLMDYNSIADHIGVEAAVLRLWRSRGKMPEPDYIVAQSPGWLAETIEDWVGTFGEDGRAPARKRAS